MHSGRSHGADVQLDLGDLQLGSGLGADRQLGGRLRAARTSTASRHRPRAMSDRAMPQSGGSTSRSRAMSDRHDAVGRIDT